MIRGFLKDLQPEQKVALAVALKERAPQLADLIDEVIAEPAPNQESPTPADQEEEEEGEPPTLTADEKEAIARYTIERLKEGVAYPDVAEEVCKGWDLDLDESDLQGVVFRYRNALANREKTKRIDEYAQALAESRRLLAEEQAAHQRDLQAEREAHLATKAALAQRLLDYRDGLVLRWAGSILAAGVAGLALGRLLR